MAAGFGDNDAAQAPADRISSLRKREQPNIRNSLISAFWNAVLAVLVD
jgi:hypothetical protein